MVWQFDGERERRLLVGLKQSEWPDGQSAGESAGRRVSWSLLETAGMQRLECKQCKRCKGGGLKWFQLSNEQGVRKL